MNKVSQQQNIATVMRNETRSRPKRGRENTYTKEEPHSCAYPDVASLRPVGH